MRGTPRAPTTTTGPGVDRLYPLPAEDVDVYAIYRPVDPRASLVRLNIVASLDGHITDGAGVSGSLGGEGDRQVFFALRNMADAVLAGAGTVRAERYGPMRVRQSLAARRAADGLTGPVPVVVVTRSLDLDLEAPLFSQAVVPTMVLTTTDAPRERVADVRAAGGVVVAVGRGDVDLAGAITVLGLEHGLHHLLVEGGATLNGRLLAAGLVDELCVTVAPVLVGGMGTRRLVEGLRSRHELGLAQVLHHDGELLMTYRVDPRRAMGDTHAHMQD
ncbi:MAG TPA: dihydrofolate reductase family protein [Euzebya sp.]|nr:dihydrofolate reductase family protein [Euzebya sp.]